jgi:hypothetical protein
MDFTGYAPASSLVSVQPLWNYTASGTNIVTGQTRLFSTGTIVTSSNQVLSGIPGTLIVSNVTLGAYAVSFYSAGNPSPVAVVTNIFTNGTPAFVNGVNYIGVSTNAVTSSGYAYTVSQANALFLFNTNPVAGGPLSFPTNTFPPPFPTNLVTTNSLWQAPSNYVMWFGRWDGNTNPIYLGHIP